jgi:hypothetical protein
MGAHPLYAALDMATLPGDRGAASGPYQPPILPTTTQSVTITSTGSQARADISKRSTNRVLTAS